jgi:hypothetical protein
VSGKIVATVTIQPERLYCYSSVLFTHVQYRARVWYGLAEADPYPYLPTPHPHFYGYNVTYEICGFSTGLQVSVDVRASMGFHSILPYYILYVLYYICRAIHYILVLYITHYVLIFLFCYLYIHAVFQQRGSNVGGGGVNEVAIGVWTDGGWAHIREAWVRVGSHGGMYIGSGTSQGDPRVPVG